jgi:protein SCO1/2
MTEAPPARMVGLEEHLGTRLPLDLTFRDEDGKPVRLGDLITRPTVIAPVYYRCPNVCHFLQGELAQVLPQLKLAAGSDYQVLSISFDDTETPELARRTRDTYLAAAGGKIPAAGWRFLTGDSAAILALTGTAGYHFQRVGGEFQHPVAIFVVGTDGMIIRYLHGTRILPKDLTLALYEAREGHVGTTIRKMVQYCFSYDPQAKTYVFNVLRVSATVILVTLGAFLTFLLLTREKKPKDHHP